MPDPLPLRRPAVFADVPDLAVAFTTRRGGVSRPPFATLNLGLSTADDPAAVQENRRRMAVALGLPGAALAIAGQVHGADVATVSRPGLYPGLDGLVTRARGVLLCISAADCAAVLLADPEAGVIGACHAGWRGTVAGIVPNTVAAMEALGARPARMRAYVSPCISAERFEVGEEVAAAFAPAFVRRKATWPRPHVDLKAAIRAHLEAAGVEAVDVDPACTMTDTDTFFSYRGEQGQTGRMMGVIGWRP
ncbi:MAG: peptidoglycan editing factor PgeF [Bacteroidetes bacterium]|nr:polyphenol oxidoreductase [Rhodothermaceae bacterium RA]RMH57147.1 MAG: peptidoglycan editing factor PgeF [Bacteroidota bacterium]